jgi:hydroxyacylglutathione hydrolase
MHSTVAFMQRTVICLTVLALGYVVSTVANPQDYPQFAQQQEDPSIPITFIGVELVKQHLDAGRPQLLVDVRSAGEYADGHLPKAVSIPLEVLSVRMTEIPRDIPVVLY